MGDRGIKMPFQPINFRSHPQNIDLSRLTEGLMQGLQFRGQMGTQKLRDDILKEQLAGIPRQRQTQDLQDALLKARILQMEKQAAQPLGGQILPGSIGQAQGLQKIGEAHGFNSDVYKNAKRAFETELASREAMTQFRNIYGDLAEKRISSPLGKLGLEMQEIEQGYLPGSGGKIALSPEEQEVLKGQYELKRQKDISDSQARSAALRASNIDKTLGSINVDDLTQYGGLKGSTKLQKDRFLSATGKAPEEFKKYQQALTNATLLAKQVRQFYGDSITPQVQEKMAILTNPSSWINNPEVAKENFKAFKEILQKETETFRGALKDVSEFKSSQESEGVINYKWNSETGGVE